MERYTACTVIDSLGFACLTNGKPRQFGALTLPAMCDAHWAMHHEIAENRFRNDLIGRMDQEGILQHTTGWTYVIQLPNGNVKIGCTGEGKAANGDGLVTYRWKRISQQHRGLITPIALIRGGETRETLAHIQWQALRLPILGEQFIADPTLIEWARSQGFDPDAMDQVHAYADWYRKNITRYAEKSAVR